MIRAEESAEEASELDADNLRIEGEWVWYHGCRRVGARNVRDRQQSIPTGRVGKMFNVCVG